MDSSTGRTRGAKGSSKEDRRTNKQPISNTNEQHAGARPKANPKPQGLYSRPKDGVTLKETMTSGTLTERTFHYVDSKDDPRKKTGQKTNEKGCTLHHSFISHRRKNEGKYKFSSSWPRDIPSGKQHSFVDRESVLIMIMNANGDGKADKRREGLKDIINNVKPKLVLFQEFVWRGISGKIWEKQSLPTHYQYFGNTEASLLYDARDIIAQELSSTDLRKILEELQRTSNNRLKTPFPTDFDPLPRTCASLVMTIGVPFWEIICVSWHGPYTGHSLDQRKTYFQYLLEFLRKVQIRFKRPLLLAGDFNIDFACIEPLIKNPFKSHSYSASRRRESAVKDYFLTTEDLDLSKIQFVDIGEHQVSFDHDPVKACLKVVSVPKTACIDYTKAKTKPTSTARV